MHPTSFAQNRFFASNGIGNWFQIYKTITAINPSPTDRGVSTDLGVTPFFLLLNAIQYYSKHLDTFLCFFVYILNKDSVLFLF